MFNEADTRAKLIDPMLHACGWDEDKIAREKSIKPGRLIDDKGSRKKGEIADYVLVHNSVNIAVVEAKDEGKSALVGMQQAKTYCEDLTSLFAYSTNGHEIEEFDFITNKQKTLDNFPSPESLWKRYLDYTLKERIIEDKSLEYPYYSVLGSKTPRYYQDAAIKKSLEAMINGENRILVTMATGTGKTYAAFQLVWKLLKSERYRRVLYLADRIFLRDQAFNEFSPFGDARDVIEEGKAPKNRDIFFSMYQSMYAGEEGNRLYQQYPPDFFDLIIIDECHRSGFGTWREILDYFGNATQLGMTATPKRDENIDTYSYFGEPVYTYSMGKAIEDGFLAPFQIHRTFTNIDKNGLNIKEAIYQGAQIYIPEEADLKEVYTLEDYERQIVLPDRTAELCDSIAKKLRTFGPMQRTIIFCVNMDHAAEVAKGLQNRFADLGHSDYAVRIVSEERDAKALFERFSDSDNPLPVIATTVDLLTTGINVPSVQNIILVKPVGSKVVFHQIIGRGSRIDSLTNKYFFRIIDYVNATRLLDSWDYPPKGKPAKLVKGPFDLSVEGIIIDHETQQPIGNVSVKAQLGPNMQRNTRSGIDGRFKLNRLPHSPITISVSSSGFRSKQLTLTPESDMPLIVLELKPKKIVQKKIKLKGIDVYITNETRIILTSDGQNLTDAEYKEFSKNGILKRATSLNDLRRIWQDSEKRKQLLEDFKEQSIYPELLSNLLKRPDADSFDVLAHIAFDVSMISREERTKAFTNKNLKFFEAYNSEAQQVLMTLLEKYQMGGIEEISKPEIFRLPPFDKMKYITGVAKRFGGFGKLREALDSLQRGLYSANNLGGNGIK